MLLLTLRSLQREHMLNMSTNYYYENMKAINFSEMGMHITMIVNWLIKSEGSRLVKHNSKLLKFDIICITESKIKKDTEPK